MTTAARKHSLSETTMPAKENSFLFILCKLQGGAIVMLEGLKIQLPGDPAKEFKGH